MSVTPEQIVELQEAIQENAVSGVESVLVDGMSVRKVSLDSQIRALRELQGLNSGVLANGGMRHFKLISPPGGGG